MLLGRLPTAYAMLAAVAGLALAGGAYMVFQHRRPEPARAQSGSSYVNPAVCAGCHQDIAKTYALTGMARSFYRPRAENTVEDYDKHNQLHHRASGRNYTMVRSDGKWTQRRQETGFDGQVTNVVEKDIDYVIGSGNHARTYLHRTKQGKLMELPVTWYSERGGYWAMSPGYDKADPADFRRAISFECFSCHNGYPASVPSSGTGDTEPVFADTLPEGIDCQRCHGPGSDHVAAAGTVGAAKDSIRKAIVNPARLNRERQLDVCRQCHLQTTSIRSPDSIRRYDRPPFSYRPGEPLRDDKVDLDFPADNKNSSRFEIDHADYRLAQSACFRGSQMTCTTCHDPHRALRGAEAVTHYETVCRTCHAAAHRQSAGILRAGATCMDCHMPKRRTQDVVHAVMTDHYIQRRKPPGDLLAPLTEAHDEKTGYRGEVVLYGAAQGPDAELYRAVAQARQEANLDPGIAQLRADIERFQPKEPAFYFELGRANRRAGHTDEAIHRLEQSLDRRTDFRPALKELGTAFAYSGQLARAIEVWERAAAAAPPDAAVFADLGGAYLQQGSFDQAEQALRRAVSIDPDLATAHNLLGLEQSHRGDRPGAEAAFRKAIRIQPDLSEAQSNLGNLLAEAGDMRQAIFHLNKAIVSDPANVDAHYNLGQALAASRSFDKAEREFRAAIQLNPEYYEAHFGLGRILAAKGDRQGARSHFEAAAKSPDPRLRAAALEFR